MNAPTATPVSFTQRPSRRRMFWRIALVVVITAVVFIAVFASPIAVFLLGGGPQFSQVQTISTTKAHFEDWNPQTDIVGSLTPINGADLALEVAGVVEKIYFESGADVKAGAPLLKLRDEDEVAKLGTLEAASELAVATQTRSQKLWDIKGISQADLESAAANLKSARAAVVQQREIVAKKTVRAPFAGHLGIRLVNVGQYINAGTPIVTLQALDPIEFDFHLPQQTLQTMRVGQPVSVKVDAYPREMFTGKIIAIDPKVDPATRNVSMRAEFTNADHRLLPGMYATGQVDVGNRQRYITLPQTAVTFNTYGNTVYRVIEKTADNKKQLIAQQTFVTTGLTRGDQVAILSGVKEGDEIVTSGQLKLQNGTQVTISNDIQPTSNPNPTPVER